MHEHRRAAAPSLAVWLAVALAAHPLSAQDERSADCGRCLGGHRFLPSSVVNLPFASDHFVNSTGGGMAFDLQIPVRNLDGDTVRIVGGDIGFMLLDFEFQKRVIERLALRGTLGGVARVGTTPEAIVASGAEALFNWSVGATVPIWGTGNFLVAGVVDYRHNNEFVVDPYGFARLIRDEGLTDSSTATLLRDEAGSHWSAGARAAWTVNPWFGLNVVVEAGEIDSEVIGNRTLTTLGLQTSFDFVNLWDFPLGTSLAYREQIGPGRNGDASGSYRAFELGLFYTGSRGFTIGADIIWSKVKVQQADIPDLDVGQFRLVTRLDFR
jgi:hypothetical protein